MLRSRLKIVLLLIDEKRLAIDITPRRLLSGTMENWFFRKWRYIAEHSNSGVLESRGVNGVVTEPKFKEGTRNKNGSLDALEDGASEKMVR